MNIETQYYKRVVLVAVDGRIDRPEALELKDVLLELVEEGHHNMVIDLSGVDLMGSEALRTLIAGRNASKIKGGAIAIANPSDQANYAVTIGGLDTVFDIYDDVVSAVASF